MKKAEALKHIESGEPMFFVEYRNSNVGKVEYRDKNSGQPASFIKLVHAVEMGNIQVAISERVTDKMDIENYKPPFKKGQLCVFHVVSFRGLKPPTFRGFKTTHPPRR